MGEAASEMRRARADRLSELPDSLLLHVLSLLHRKQIVRTSVLSTRWRFLWMSVPVSLEFNYLGFNLSNFLASINNELYYWRFCEKIQSFRLSDLTYDDSYVKHFDLCVHFATKAANVEDFTLKINYSYEVNDYVFPQFAYKNTSLKNLALQKCQLNPSVSVNWTSLLSLSISDTVLKDGVMEKVLSGCPNLEHLELYEVGIHRLEISSPKLRELIMDDICPRDGVEIIAPYILYLRLTGFCFGIHFGRNVPSLVTALLYIDFEFGHYEDKLEEECSYLRELLQSVAHVKNLELGVSCIEVYSYSSLYKIQSTNLEHFDVANAVVQSKLL